METAAPTPAPQGASLGVGCPPPAAVRLFGLDFHAVTNDQALAWVLHLARRPGADLVMTPNVDHVLRSRRDPRFRALYDHAAFVVADGQPVVWASRLLGRRLPERVAGSDLMPRLCIEAARQGLTYYFVGGNPGDAAKAAAVIAAAAGRDGCVGIDCPPFGFERDPAYVDAMVERINLARPDVLCIGLGSPKQEELMVRIRNRVQARVLLGVGVTFSFVAGTVRRAPAAFRRLGLEWLWRLACEPRRLWRRYLDNLVRFQWAVLREGFGG